MQTKYHYYIQRLVLIGITSYCLFASCKKENFYADSNARLSFSTTMMTFDTVFTTIGSVTQILKVSNPYKNAIKTDIVLRGGGISFFSVNVDGVSGTTFKEVEIPAQDSIFIFIKVNVNPNGGNVPLLIADTLFFYTNGNRQNVELLAFGEDANFIVPDKELKDGAGNVIPYKIVAHEGEQVEWKKDKPYVIYGYAVVDSTAKLSIEAGTQIYLHKGGSLWVYPGGCLHVNGTKEEPIVFQGDGRAFANDRDYAQWNRIWINEGSQDNIINYAIIKNAFIGIQAEILQQGMGNKLVLTNTLIKCSNGIGFLGRSYTVEAYNNVIADCRQYCLALTQGGNYTFINNTIYNQYAQNRSEPSALFCNYYDVDAQTRYIGDFTCDFINNIVYGATAKEFDCSIIKEATFSLHVENCLLKTDEKALAKITTHANLIVNQDPLVKNVAGYDFSLNTLSPCKAKGKTVSMPLDDITGTNRSQPPSIGAYE